MFRIVFGLTLLSSASVAQEAPRLSEQQIKSNTDAGLLKAVPICEANKITRSDGTIGYKAGYNDCAYIMLIKDRKDKGLDY